MDEYNVELNRHASSPNTLYLYLCPHKAKFDFQIKDLIMACNASCCLTKIIQDKISLIL